MVKCRVQQYDPAVTEPPLQFVTLNEFECHQPEDDYLGERFCMILHSNCWRLGYSMKFYSNSDDENYDYDVVVEGEL